MEKKYNIIYADPPWQYKVWSKKGKGRSAEDHYSTQSMAQLFKLDIATICRPDCALFMWATFPCLQEALALGQNWGFSYKTVAFVWVKTNRHDHNLMVGLGYYTRANAEIVLLFTKGKPLKRISKKVGQVVVTKIGKHSVKPPEVRNRIVALLGDLPRIELFARSREGFFPDDEYMGWDVFGDEADRSVELP